jgi:CheY-like chemotaxis protein
VKPIILFVEDDETFAAWNREFMESQGDFFEAMHVTSRDEALQRIRDHGRHIALMFCDMNFLDNPQNAYNDNYGPDVISFAKAAFPDITIIATSLTFKHRQNDVWLADRRIPALSKEFLSKEAYFAKLESVVSHYEHMLFRGAAIPAALQEGLSAFPLTM